MQCGPRIFLPHRKPRHNAGNLSFDAVVTYPFHPLCGHTVEVVGDVEHDLCRHFLIRQAHGGAFYLPAWMIGAEAGLIEPVDTSRLPLAQLWDLRVLLDQLLNSSADAMVNGGDVDEAPTSPATRPVHTDCQSGSMEPRGSSEGGEPAAAPAD